MKFLLLKTSIPVLMLLCLITGREAKAQGQHNIIAKEVLYTDTIRQREVPVALFYPDSSRLNGLEVIIFSHGYGANQGGDYLKYNYLTENLARHGYFVASIQHELPSDELLPMTGNPQQDRLPNWQRGAKNIAFVLAALKRQYPALNYSRLTVMGHSNGGDMSVLFAAEHKALVHKLITLDQRRMAFPRLSQPRIYSLRSSDQHADNGVLPDAKEARRYKMTIVKLEHTAHNEMDEDATEDQRKEINDWILKFLSDR